MSAIAPGFDTRDEAPVGEDGPDRFIDAHIGARLTLLRVSNGMTAAEVGRAIGLSFHEVQEYERGANRISASRLYDIAQMFDVPVSWFFEGDTSSEPDATDEWPQTFELLRAHFRIADPAIRHRLLDVIRAISRRRDS